MKGVTPFYALSHVQDVVMDLSFGKVLNVTTYMSRYAMTYMSLRLTKCKIWHHLLLKVVRDVMT